MVLNAFSCELIIDGELCTVHRVKSGKTWRAYGTFRTRQIEGKGRTESEALSDWKSRAKYEANG